MVSKSVLASYVLGRSGLGSLLRHTGGHHGFVALNYHRIGYPDECEFDRGVFSATPEAFERQLEFLKKECDVIVPADIEDLPRRGRGNYAMITFDDGYRDNHDIALPLLRAANLKAVFFIATGFIDQARLSWWDEIAWMVRTSARQFIGPTAMLPVCLTLEEPERQQAIGSLLTMCRRGAPDLVDRFLDDLAQATGSGRAPVSLAQRVWMDWDMVMKLHEAGMVVGGHTVHHPILSLLARPEQEMEITGCARALEQHLKIPMRVFSYPRGKPDAFNYETRASLAAAHVEYAFSYYGGMNLPALYDRYDVRRVSVDVGAPLEHFEAMVTLPRIFA